MSSSLITKGVPGSLGPSHRTQPRTFEATSAYQVRDFE
ncbi:Protein of unknown function [Pyronema omphalodes CBS 100304]|uniref:Uncharacterized protein n=1 Tax=Pyronema omphalodes (strain CBS 100304) TaxID=1076935 RepID=U4LDA1_PYROM|nr:Protein of unknown function [Pyronema omphalodes CBS 100304]